MLLHRIAVDQCMQHVRRVGLHAQSNVLTAAICQHMCEGTSSVVRCSCCLYHDCVLVHAAFALVVVYC
jgi:hypothetical protein